MNPLLVSQRTWAKELGISVWTFRRWLAVGRIPQPLDLTGWPRWSRKVVDQVNAEIARSGEGRYFRTAQTRRRHRPLQSDPSNLQQSQRAFHRKGVSSELIGDVHAPEVTEGVDQMHVHSMENGR